MGELLERICGFGLQRTGADRFILRGESAARGHQVVPFRMLTLFSPEQLTGSRGFPHSEFRKDTPVGWFEGTNLAERFPDLCSRSTHFPRLRSQS